MVSRVPRLHAEAVTRPPGRHGADWVGSVDGWPSRRPSLAYQWALDVSAVDVHRLGRPATLIAAHPVLGPEAARRLGVEWAMSSQPGARRAEPALPEIPAEGAGAWGVAPGGVPQTVLWVEPTTLDWHQTLARVERLLEEAGDLLVLTSSPWLARGLPEWSASVAHDHRNLLGGWAVVRRLCAADWSVESIIGFRGLRGLSLGALARLAAMGRRDALADRLSVRMRACFVEYGLLARLGTVALVRARPPARQDSTPGEA